MQSRQHAVHSVAPGAKPVFEVLIVYEDFTAGRRATDACNLLMANLGDELELRCSMWKFEVLRCRKLNEIAAAEAAEADTIIIAARGASPLPAEVTGWIDAWLPQRDGQPAALIALMDDDDVSRDDATPSVSDYLRRVAAAGKMDFLPHVFGADGFSHSHVLPQPAMSAPPFDDLPWHSSSDRDWGINE